MWLIPGERVEKRGADEDVLTSLRDTTPVRSDKGSLTSLAATLRVSCILNPSFSILPCLGVTWSAKFSSSQIGLACNLTPAD